MRHVLVAVLLAALAAAVSGCATTTPGGKRVHSRSQDQDTAAPFSVQTGGKVRTRANVIR